MEKKNLGRLLLNEYGISEWEEKCALLSREEQTCILNSLRDGEYNILVDLVKLPYPSFANEYIKLYRDKIKSRKIEAIEELQQYLLQESKIYADLGYKLYVMPVRLVKMLGEYIRNPERSIYSIKNSDSQDLNFNDIMSYLNTPLENVYKARFTKNQIRNAVKRYIHVMSYVDAKEAENLELSGYTFKRFNQYQGFGMDEKLQALNPLIRHIVMENLGFNGSYVSATQIASDLNIYDEQLTDLFTDEFYYALTKSPGEFKNFIKLLDRKYEEGERRAYALKSPFKKICDRIESTFVMNCLRENGEEITNSSQLKNRYSNSLEDKYYLLIDKKLSNPEDGGMQL